MKKILFALMLLVFPVLVFAQVANPSGDLAPQDFLSQAFAAIKGLGGLGWVMKISAIITLVVSSMKVSFLRSLIWDKLGGAKTYVGLALALIAGLLSQFPSGQLSMPVLFAYLFAGGGSVILHEFLDSIKAIPTIGPFWVSIISLIESNLGGGSQPPAPPAPPAAS